MESILIIDDEKDNLEALRRDLREEFDIESYTSPLEALKRLTAKNFHVVLSDQRMPEMTGVDFFEKVKLISPEATRILLTGYTDLESVIEAINRGQVYRYVSKPWEADELKLVLKQGAEYSRLKSEIIEKNKRLEKALEELKTLDRAKASFISLISHELNTPLTILQSYLDMIEKDPKQLGSALPKLREATNRFSELIQKILLHVEIVSNPNIEKSKMSLKELHERILTELSPLVKKKDLRLSVFSNVEKILVDPQKFELGLKLLWEDFFLRAKEKTEVRVQAENQGPLLKYTLTRTGEPLTPQLFEPFMPSNQPLHHQKNIGLNLFLFKWILTLHEGALAFSTKGSEVRFEFEIPLDH